jgi:hypothetical protein
MNRCPWAIKFSACLHTRCMKEDPGHEGEHEGRGLAQFSEQRITWYPGDQREYLTERDDEHAWQEQLRRAADYGHWEGEVFIFTPPVPLRDQSGRARELNQLDCSLMDIAPGLTKEDVVQALINGAVYD